MRDRKFITIWKEVYCYMTIVRMTCKSNNISITENQLYQICTQIIPAALNTPLGPLWPGCIEFYYQEAKWYAQNIDILIEIKAYKFPDRDENKAERATMIMEAFKKVLPTCSCAVWLELSDAVWVSSETHYEIDVDMSMDAAIKRLKNKGRVPK